MKPFAVGLFLFALSAFLFPGLTAQDKADDKKDAAKKDAKDEKKADEKKGDEKKDEKKDDLPKKSSGKAKNVDPEEEKILAGTVRLTALIRNMDANSAGEFTVELRQAWPAKVQ